MDDHQPLILGRYGSYVKKLKTQLNAHASRIECEEKMGAKSVVMKTNLNELSAIRLLIQSPWKM